MKRIVWTSTRVIVAAPDDIDGAGERSRSKPIVTRCIASHHHKDRLAKPEALAPGKHTSTLYFKYDGLGAATLAYNDLSGIGRGGTGTLKVDGKVVSTQKLERTVPLSLLLDQRFARGHQRTHAGG